MKSRVPLSLVDHIVNKIEDVYYKNDYRARSKIMEQHRTSAGISSDSSYVLNYLNFRQLIQIEDKEPIIIKPSQDVKDAIIAWAKKDKEFQYNLDKVRNYLSYLSRYAGAEEVYDKYIPKELSDGYNTTRLILSSTAFKNVEEEIDRKFKEEKVLLKKFYLMVKLDEMQ